MIQAGPEGPPRQPTADGCLWPPPDRRAGPPDRRALTSGRWSRASHAFSTCIRFARWAAERDPGKERVDVRRQTVRPGWVCGSPEWVVCDQTSEAAPILTRAGPQAAPYDFLARGPRRVNCRVRREAGPPRLMYRRSRPHTQPSPTTRFGRVTSACSCSDPFCASGSSYSTGRRAHSSSVTVCPRPTSAASASATIRATSEATTTCWP